MSLPAEANGSPAQEQPVQEFVDSRGLALKPDSSVGVLRGVKLLGLASKNGRQYRESALRDAIALYEGAKVNVNHPDRDPLAPRDYRDRLGVVRNVRLEANVGLFGDLHFNPKHALAEQLAWDAANAPENVGLSHNVIALTRRDGDQLFVESISRVQSVDLVADPATTRGLYEHAHLADEPPVSEESARLIEATETASSPSHTQQEELSAARKRAQLAELSLEHGIAPDHGAFWSTVFAGQVARCDESQLASLFEDRVLLVKRASKVAGPESRERTVTPSASATPIDSTAEFVSAISRAA